MSPPDPKCVETARYFLPEADHDVVLMLAEEIQTTVEMFEEPE